MTTTTKSQNDPFGKTYFFHDVNPRFFLESLPSADKKQFYKFVSDWMDRGDLLNEFSVDIDVLDGRGNTIQIWSFTKCEITSYGHICKILPISISSLKNHLLKLEIGLVFHAREFL